MKAADALKDFIKRICKKNDYHCLGIIGVSRNDGHFGQITVNKNGKRIFNNCLPTYLSTTEPHLHILIIANPASSIRKLIEEYMIRKHGHRVTWSQIADSYYEHKISYIMEQSEKLRTIDLFSAELNPLGFNFIHTAESRHYELGNIKRLFYRYDYNAPASMFFVMEDDMQDLVYEPQLDEYISEIRRCGFLKPLAIDD